MIAPFSFKSVIKIINVATYLNYLNLSSYTVKRLSRLYLLFFSLRMREKIRR